MEELREECQLIPEEGGQYYTVIMGKEYRPPSPEPPSSPCPNSHTVTGLGLKEGWQGRAKGEQVVVRSVHHCTLLNASVIMGRTKEVKQILEKSKVTLDSLNTAYDCSGSPVLCEAAYHNQIESMKLLLEYGAFVDITNHLGLTPAHIAACNGKDKPDMLSLLMQYKADINKRSKDGSTPLHIAAEKGNVKIVKMLLQSNQVKDEILVETYRHGGLFLPPPIILAAANHHKQVVNVLKNSQCPPFLTSNVELVFWAHDVIANYFWQRGVLRLNDIFTKLDQALQERQQEFLTEFGQTIYNGKELELKQDPLEIINQSLTLLECLIGPNSKLLIYEIERLISTFRRRNVKQFVICELMLQKVLKIMPKMEIELKSIDAYMMPSHLHVSVSLFMSNTFWETLGVLTANRHAVNYVILLENFIEIIDVILELKTRQSCQEFDHWGESFQNIFCQLLSLFAAGLYSSNQPNSPTNKKNLYEIGSTIINKYSQHMDEYFTSFLHFTLRKAKAIVDVLKLSMIGARNSINSYIHLLEVLLLMGCSDVTIINTPYKQFFCKGELPLHMAVRLAEMDPCYLPIVNLMFIHGAHYDGISLTGVIPVDIATRPQLQACFDLKPLPLACLASQVIVACKMEYRNISYLPRAVKRFISYHDTEIKMF